MTTTTHPAGCWCPACPDHDAPEPALAACEKLTGPELVTIAAVIVTMGGLLAAILGTRAIGVIALAFFLAVGWLAWRDGLGRWPK